MPAPRPTSGSSFPSWRGTGPGRLPRPELGRPDSGARFAPGRSDEIVDALIEASKDVVSATIDSSHGHDSFLLPVERYFDVLRAYLTDVAEALGK